MLCQSQTDTNYIIKYSESKFYESRKRIYLACSQILYRVFKNIFHVPITHLLLNYMIEAVMFVSFSNIVYLFLCILPIICSVCKLKFKDI